MKLSSVFPCDARILFQGDSITDGNRGRDWDPNHILGHGYAFIVGAKLGAECAERNWTFLNRGISGNKVTDLAERWDADTLALRPDVLSILIGVNDASASVPVEKYERDYDALLSSTVAALPAVRLVLCEPFSLPVGPPGEKWATWNPHMEQLRDAVDRLGAKHAATVVKLQKVFEDACRRAPAQYWMWDGVHPTYSGHHLIAEEWMRVLMSNSL